MNSFKVFFKAFGGYMADFLLSAKELGMFWSGRIMMNFSQFSNEVFMVKVAGGIADFRWENDEEFQAPTQERSERHKPVMKIHRPEVKPDQIGSSQEKTARSKKTSLPIRMVKRLLRFLFISIPEFFVSDKVEEMEEAETFENRIRR